MEVLPPFWIWQCHVVVRRPIRHFSPVKFLAANNILLMRRWNHACSLLVYVISVITPGRQRALTAFWRYCLLKNKLSDRMIKQLLNSVIAKYRDLSVSRRSIICLSLRLQQIIDLLATDESRYFVQPHPIIANCSHLYPPKYLSVTNYTLSNSWSSLLEQGV